MTIISHLVHKVRFWNKKRKLSPNDKQEISKFEQWLDAVAEYRKQNPGKDGRAEMYEKIYGKPGL
jgi:hypothetical protein